MMNPIPTNNLETASLRVAERPAESDSQTRRREDKLRRLHQKGIAITPSDLDALQAYSQRIQHHLRVLQATTEIAE